MSDDQFEAMLATMPDPLRKGDDLYCGHVDQQGLSWTRKYCPICNPHLACPVCGGTGDIP